MQAVSAQWSSDFTAPDAEGTMTAVVLRRPGRDGLEIGSVPIPRPGRMEVLCRVDAAYICGTDPHIVAGDYPGFWPGSYPFVPGHEWAGTVVTLGPGVEAFGWRVGDRVAGTSHCGCGYCRMCMTGRYNLCENYGNQAMGHRQYGHNTPGAYAEYVLHSVKSLVKVPTTMDLEEAAAIDPAAIALHSVKRAQVAAGEDVVVIGPGPMGLMVVQCAVAVGAGRVFVVGRGARLAKSADLGAEPIDYSAGEPVGAIRAATGGSGAHAVIDCAGSPESLAQAIEVTRKGGHISVVGIPLRGGQLPIAKLVLEEIDLHGVRANPNTAEEVVPLMQRGLVSARRLLTHRFPLCEFPAALDTFVERRDGATKVLIVPDPTGEHRG